MNFENILIETHGRVGLVRLNRPKALNALNDQLMNELGDALLAFDADEKIACIILTGNEKAFAAEQLLMEKHDFPATRCHLEQHARVLCALHQAHPAVTTGDHNLAIHVGGRLLPEWFELHNSTLDASVSVWASYQIGLTTQAANYGGQMINFAATPTSEAARPT